MPGFFEPDRNVGGYMLLVNRVGAEGSQSDLVYGASGSLEQPHLIPRSRERFGPDDSGSPFDEWGDGVYRVAVYVAAVDWSDPHGVSLNTSVDPAEDLAVTIEDGIVVSAVPAP